MGNIYINHTLFYALSLAIQTHLCPVRNKRDFCLSVSKHNAQFFDQFFQKRVLVPLHSKLLRLVNTTRPFAAFHCKT